MSNQISGPAAITAEMIGGLERPRYLIRASIDGPTIVYRRLPCGGLREVSFSDERDQALREAARRDRAERLSKLAENLLAELLELQ
jgi:hypothetical protein